MFCGNCGSKAIEGDLFCVTCGQALEPASTVKSTAVPWLEEPSKQCQELAAKEARPSTPPMCTTVPKAVPEVGDDHMGSSTPRLSTFTSFKESTVKKTGAWTELAHRRRLIYAGIAALAVVGVLGVSLSLTAAGTPPADPAKALRRLSAVANIGLPIVDDAIDSGQVLTPNNIPQQPAAVGEYFGAVSMTSGSSVELRVSAYEMDADAAVDQQQGACRHEPMPQALVAAE